MNNFTREEIVVMKKGATYYDIASNDYNYFQQFKKVVNPDYNNPLAVQSHQIIEKLLKHIIDCYCQEENQEEILSSHKLQTLYQAIHKVYSEFQLKRDDLLFLTSFYDDARHPGVDYIMVNEEDALRCIQIVEEVKGYVDAFIQYN